MTVELVVVALVAIVLGNLAFFGGLLALSEFANRVRIASPSRPREEDEDEIDHRFY